VDDFSALMWTFFPPSSFSDGPLFHGRFILVDLFSVDHFSVDVFSVDVISVDLFSYIPSSGSPVRSEILRPSSTRNETDETLSSPCVSTATG